MVDTHPVAGAMAGKTKKKKKCPERKHRGARVARRERRASDIAAFRQEIDRIDDVILELLNKRARLAIEIGRAKASRNLGFYSPERERAIFERLSANNEGPFPKEALRAVFREILSASLSLEKPLKVSFLGPRATFTHLACLQHFGRSSQFLPERNIRSVFEGVERERVDCGVIPIENSTEGVIAHTLDLFMECDVRICEEIMIEISLDLLSRSERLGDIRRVYSHPQAIAQCRNWLESHLEDVEIVDVPSTAKAAEIASTEPHSGAVASSYAAKLYDLNVLERRIQDIPHNYTRFLVIGRNDGPPSGRDKTSLMFSLKDNVGALYHALKPFAEHGVNLTKIESRPHKGKAWDYIFFLDLEGHHTDRNLVDALEAFREVCSDLKLLGSYPRGRQVHADDMARIGKNSSR
jgi:chorismate mutase / prephenate dehydratase